MPNEGKSKKKKPIKKINMPDYDKNELEKLSKLMDEDVKFMNTETGEIHNKHDYEVTTPKLRQQNKEFFEKKKERYFAKQGQKEKTKETGAFVFMIFRNCQEEFADLSPQSLTRLMLLATYLNYGDNLLMCKYDLPPELYKRTMKKSKHPQFVPMTKHAMRKALGLSANIFRELYNELILKKYLFKREEGFYLSADYFRRGVGTAIDIPNERRTIRLFINQLANIYDSVENTSHVHLGYVFMLIPFINLRWNIICYNPLEEDKDNIQPMTLGDFCEIAGYGRENAGRLVGYYDDILFDSHGRKMRLVTFIHHEDEGQMKIMVNPYVLYAGDDMKRVELLGHFALEDA